MENMLDVNLTSKGPDRFIIIPVKAVPYIVIFIQSRICVMESMRDMTNMIRGIVNACTWVISRSSLYDLGK
ncbi:MAG: hypothetical protein GY775_00600 [Candidatus Scalindua sp.]|nr:hypothetical protein [Candidatus Scalindua sp.]